ncbi:hypothetical protein J4463_00100 [Candidatus Pacearchaeota archaeon]|nr:hypothetical protein [Candidatus Pacearchaeota archaeon]
MNSILRDVSKLQELDVKELDLLDKTKQVEGNFLKAHQLITKGGPSIRKKE